jgi:ketosteroid isomerase-like protein
MGPLEAYIDGWRRHDVPAVLATLAEDCVVIESYGPVYRGRARVGQWMETWLSSGGAVLDWEITSREVAGALLVAEWTFTCTWDGDTSTFDGATIARHDAGAITYLREYATTAALYEWTGTWRA